MPHLRDDVSEFMDRQPALQAVQILGGLPEQRGRDDMMSNVYSEIEADGFITVHVWPIFSPLPRVQQTMSERLLVEASEATGIPVTRIKGGERAQPIATVRFAIIWVMREHSGLSLPQIGRAIGNRDHTTVMHACRRAKALRDTDPAFKALCNRLEAVVAE